MKSLVLQILAWVVFVLALLFVVPYLPNPAREARKAGYEAARAGIPAEACPHSARHLNYDLRQEWLNGWIEAKMEPQQ